MTYIKKGLFVDYIYILFLVGLYIYHFNITQVLLLKITFCEYKSTIKI